MPGKHGVWALAQSAALPGSVLVQRRRRAHRIGRQRLVEDDVAAQARQRDVGELAARAAQGGRVVDLVGVRQLRARLLQVSRALAWCTMQTCEILVLDAPQAESFEVVK